MKIDEAKKILRNNGFILESNNLNHYVSLVKQYLRKNYTEDDVNLAIYPGKDNESVVVLSYFRNIPRRNRYEYSWNPSTGKVKMNVFTPNGDSLDNGYVSGIKTLEDFYAYLDKSIEDQYYE